MSIRTSIVLFSLLFFAPMLSLAQTIGASPSWMFAQKPEGNAFRPRPLPPQTRDNLAKWGLTEAIWRNGSIADFAGLNIASEAELRSAISQNDDAVALVLLAGRFFDSSQLAQAIATEQQRMDTSKFERSDWIVAAAITKVAAPDPAYSITDFPFVEATDTQQIDYLTKAADFGDPRAQWMLAQRGHSIDLKTGARLHETMLKLSAEGGLAIAMATLAHFLELGVGFDEDNTQAEVWKRRCAAMTGSDCTSLMKGFINSSN